MTQSCIQLLRSAPASTRGRGERAQELRRSRFLLLREAGLLADSWRRLSDAAPELQPCAETKKTTWP